MTQCEVGEVGEDGKVVMDKKRKVVKFEMYIDAETQQAMQTGKGVGHWRVDPDMFRSAWDIGSTVPFKAWQSDHGKALDGFARAHRRGHVNGLPVFLIEAYMEESEFLARALAGDIMLNATMPGTVSFVAPFNQQNYPTLVVDVTEISEELARVMLDEALRALSGKRKAVDMTN